MSAEAATDKIVRENRLTELENQAKSTNDKLVTNLEALQKQQTSIRINQAMV